jgi:hypothetical protein
LVDSSEVKAILRLSEAECPHGLILFHPRDNVQRVLDILAVEKIGGIRNEASYFRSVSSPKPNTTARAVLSFSRSIRCPPKVRVSGAPESSPFVRGVQTGKTRDEGGVRGNAPSG